MKSTRAKKSAPRVPRRWRTPPPLTRGSEPLEGMELLREIGGETGILLWQAYRNVMFWSSAEEGERAALFSPKAGEKRRQDLAEGGLPRVLVDPLHVLAEMLGAADDIAIERVAEACTEIARWADEEGHPVTALSFAQAAAVSAPREAHLSLAVGQLARRRGEMARAESWFRHTIMIGRQTGDWDSYSRAYVALGNMLVLRGNFPAAQRMHIKALRASRRKGLRELQGFALHDLFVIAGETGRTAQAEEYARQAFRAYGPDHQNLVSLAGDVAYFWMEQGFFERAYDVFQALEPHALNPRLRVVLLANIARAAGGSDRRDAFRRAWTEVSRLVRQPEASEVAAGCLLELAAGARSLEEWDRAEAAAQQALEAATARGQAKVAIRAEALLDAVRSGKRVEARKTPKADSAKSDQLASEFVKVLERAEPQYV